MTTLGIANEFPASLSDVYAPIAHDLRLAERIFDDELKSELPFIDELVATVRSYRGKMLRPSLLLLTARATGTLTEAHHVLAAVVEMVHMATLVHDDVLDGADERRRQPTIARLSGNTTAVLLGDYLISHAFHLCSSIGDSFASRRIGAATNTVCDGELLQNHRCGDLSMREQECIAILERKTGALTAVACELGARYAGATGSVCETMHEFGLSAGVAFQIVDDVLDIIGEQKIMGKTLGRDAELGKLTLPIIHCLAQSDSVSSIQLHRVLEGSTLKKQGHGPNLDSASPCMAEHVGNAALRTNVAECVADTASIEYAMSMAEKYVTQARECLEDFPHTPARQSLFTLTDFIISRPM
ncbi:MAG: polyprenyl synthetase family protein [Planctomycetes bacterium]|nr:polyprenyl synthetase family protein [Planctomycetota bacterium]